MPTYSNTQDFRVKHGIVVTNTASIGNSMSISGNVTITDGKALVVTNTSAIGVNNAGRSVFGNSVTVSNGSVTISNGDFYSRSANLTHTVVFTVNTATAAVSGPLSVTDEANLGSLTISGTPIINSTGYWVGPVSSLTGPKGDKGNKGDKGEVVYTTNGVYTSANNTIEFNTSDSNTYYVDATGLKGEKGQKGQKGDQGEKGDKGQKGEITDITYLFDNPTTESVTSPAIQSLIFNNTSIADVTQIIVRNIDISSTNNALIFDTLNLSGNSTFKGTLLIRNYSNTAQTTVFTVANVQNGAQTTNRIFNVLHQSGIHSYNDGDEVVFQIYASGGDKGMKGDPGPSNLVDSITNTSITFAATANSVKTAVDTAASTATALAIALG